ncbi:MAG: UDP-N-acetylglucosamine 1-carboxyvinyltransferase, partial [Slackia isoflavoniconvertens]|nr:UDP-N-acetylglucosamine 1-carboxyvinyltransferase [Slackia isoflavoniconvertens]
MAKEKIVVEGGTPLAGEVHISGAKNSALKLIAAALLGQGESAIHNVPLISDIVVMSKVIETLGGSVRRDGHTLHVDTAGVDTWETPYELVSKMRASISVLGPLVARFGKARVAMPGGCNLGARKIDMHMVGMEALGVHFHTDHGYIEASTPNGLHGAYVALDFPSVGATENTMMCAVTAKGQTVIENAAREPEIED